MPLKGLNIDLAGEKGEDKESSEISQNLFDQPTIIDNASQKSNTNIQTMRDIRSNIPLWLKEFLRAKPNWNS